jgi:hypothetical protein
MIDNIFGQLEHKYNFYKYETVNFFDKNYKVKIVVENDETDTILTIQQNNYKIYKQYIQENQDKIINLIKQYFVDIYNTKINVYKDINPRTIYFARDGSWGILFDTKVDEENGFAVFIKDEKLQIGTQDMFI